MIALLSEFWPFVLAGLGALFGLFRHQQAKTATAERDRAKEQVAQAEATAAAKSAALAKVQNAAAERGAIEAGVHATASQPGGLDEALRREGLVE